MASGGTLFLDEIGDVPLALQAKLLRALENRAIQRVGGGNEVEVDFRLVCATHQNIEGDMNLENSELTCFTGLMCFQLLSPH